MTPINPNTIITMPPHILPNSITNTYITTIGMNIAAIDTKNCAFELVVFCCNLCVRFIVVLLKIAKMNKQGKIQPGVKNKQPNNSYIVYLPVETGAIIESVGIKSMTM